MVDRPPVVSKPPFRSPGLHLRALELAPMDNLVVRLAAPADAEWLARLRFEFRAGVRHPTEDEASFVVRCAAWMEQRLSPGSGWHCWVVERSGDLGGHLWLQLIEKIPNPVTEREHHAYITNVYVRPAMRGSGAGAALMAAAMDWCRAHEVDSVILWPTERSRSLYGRFGFAVRDDIMEAVLDQGRLGG